MIRDVTDMIRAYFDAFTLASTHKLYSYLFLSGLLSLLIGSLIFGAAYGLSDNLGELLQDLYPFDWGKEVIETIAGWFSGILIALIGLFLYKYIILILVAPLMSPLSEKLEEGMAGTSDGVEFSWTRMIKEMLRGVRIGLRNIFKEMIYSIGLLILGLIPGIAIISAPGIYFVQAYYAGFGNMDYFLERHYNVKDSALFVNRYRGAAAANGAIFLMLLLIPVLGLFFAPFLATIAGTKVAYNRMVEEAEIGYSY